MKPLSRSSCQASRVIRIRPERSPFLERSAPAIPLPISELVPKVLAEYGLSASKTDPADCDSSAPSRLDLLA